MTTAKQREYADPRNSPATGSEHFHQLVRSVLTRMNLESSVVPGPTDEESGQQVLFDIDVDGERYLLIKTIARPAAGGLTLSPREREIVRRVALGQQNKVIATAFGISSWTVCTHLRRIFAKLGVSSRAAMVAKAAEIDAMNQILAAVPLKKLGR